MILNFECECLIISYFSIESIHVQCSANELTKGKGGCWLPGIVNGIYPGIIGASRNTKNIINKYYYIFLVRNHFPRIGINFCETMLFQDGA